jgi:hypothetical protein
MRDSTRAFLTDQLGDYDLMLDYLKQAHEHPATTITIAEDRRLVYFARFCMAGDECLSQAGELTYDIVWNVYIQHNYKSLRDYANQHSDIKYSRIKYLSDKFLYAYRYSLWGYGVGV